MSPRTLNNRPIWSHWLKQKQRRAKLNHFTRKVDYKVSEGEAEESWKRKFYHSVCLFWLVWLFVIRLFVCDSDVCVTFSFIHLHIFESFVSVFVCVYFILFYRSGKNIIMYGLDCNLSHYVILIITGYRLNINAFISK